MDDPVNFAPLLDLVVEIAVVVLTPVLLWVAQRAARRLGLELDERQRVLLDKLIQRGITYARNTIPPEQLQFDIKGPIARAAADYVARSGPDAIRHFGFDPRTEEGRLKLRQMVLAQLPPDEPRPPRLPSAAKGSMP